MVCGACAVGMYRTGQRARARGWRTTAPRVTTGLLVVVACCLPARQTLHAESQTPEISETTEFRAFTQSWWPTSGSRPSGAYAGDRSCQQCHAEKSSIQKMTPMANASYRGAVGAWGAAYGPTTAHVNPYAYRVEANGDDPKLIVGSGNQSFSADIAWTFGAGVLGQT